MSKNQNCPFNDIPAEVAKQWHDRLLSLSEDERESPSSLEIPDFGYVEKNNAAERNACDVEYAKIKAQAWVTICKWFSVTGAIVYLTHKGLLEAIAWFVRR